MNFFYINSSNLVRNPLQNLERVRHVDHQKRLNASDFQRQQQLTVREIENLGFNILSGNYPDISYILTVHSSFFGQLFCFLSFLPNIILPKHVSLTSRYSRNLVACNLSSAKIRTNIERKEISACQIRGGHVNALDTFVSKMRMLKVRSVSIYGLLNVFSNNCSFFLTVSLSLHHPLPIYA